MVTLMIISIEVKLNTLKIEEKSFRILRQKMEKRHFTWYDG